MPRRTLLGKRAIVTGASSGIGRELAVQLARQGVSLLLVARREEALQTLREELESIASENSAAERFIIAIVSGDITEESVRAEILVAAKEKLGGLDMLINNAGTSAHGRFASASEEILRRIMEVNFFSAAELTRSALPMLQKGNHPIVVNIGSILGRRGAPHNSEYCASKFALAGWSEAIRPELNKLGIDLLLVNPGTTETEFFDHVLATQGKTPWPKQKGVPVKLVARAVVRAIRKGKQEIIPSWKGRSLVWLNRLSPRLVDKLMRKWG